MFVFFKMGSHYEAGWLSSCMATPASFSCMLRWQAYGMAPSLKQHSLSIFLTAHTLQLFLHVQPVVLSLWGKFPSCTWSLGSMAVGPLPLPPCYAMCYLRTTLSVCARTSVHKAIWSTVCCSVRSHPLGPAVTWAPSGHHLELSHAWDRHPTS